MSIRKDRCGGISFWAVEQIGYVGLDRACVAFRTYFYVIHVSPWACIAFIVEEKIWVSCTLVVYSGRNFCELSNSECTQMICKHTSLFFINPLRLWRCFKSFTDGIMKLKVERLLHTINNPARWIEGHQTSLLCDTRRCSLCKITIKFAKSVKASVDSCHPVLGEWWHSMCVSVWEKVWEEVVEVSQSTTKKQHPTLQLWGRSIISQNTNLDTESNHRTAAEPQTRHGTRAVSLAEQMQHHPECTVAFWNAAHSLFPHWPQQKFGGTSEHKSTRRFLFHGGQKKDWPLFNALT